VTVGRSIVHIWQAPEGLQVVTFSSPAAQKDEKNKNKISETRSLRTCNTSVIVIINGKAANGFLRRTS
jgi:hypothetical protein